MTTIHDVAKRAAVSTATVSHVINKTRKVNLDTIARVEQAIKELQYQPNEQARGLKTGQSHMIGVFNYYSVDDYFSEVLRSLEAEASATGYNVLLRHTEPETEHQALAVQNWINQNVDGIIFNSPMITPEFQEQVNKLDCPCVLLHIKNPDCKCDVIRVNDEEISNNAVQYLIDLGHRQIACIAGITFDFHTASDRKLGYEKALKKAGLPVRNDFFITTDYNIQEGYDAFVNLMKMPERPTAIFTYSDQLALGALRAAADLGLSIPQDVSIMGFDDIKMASFCTPRLTTIFQDKELTGKLAVRQILKHKQNPALVSEIIEIPTRLIIRESTGPAPSQK